MGWEGDLVWNLLGQCLGKVSVWGSSEGTPGFSVLHIEGDLWAYKLSWTLEQRRNGVPFPGVCTHSFHSGVLRSLNPEYQCGAGAQDEEEATWQNLVEAMSSLTLSFAFTAWSLKRACPCHFGMVLARMTLQSLPCLTQPHLDVSSCVPQPWTHFSSSVRSPSGSSGTASGVQLLNKCWF